LIGLKDCGDEGTAVEGEIHFAFGRGRTRL